MSGNDKTRPPTSKHSDVIVSGSERSRLELVHTGKRRRRHSPVTRVAFTGEAHESRPKHCIPVENNIMTAASNDAWNDAFAIATGFRHANDTDTMDVLNVQSKKSISQLKTLHFYVVPATWMEKAWPVLSMAMAGAASGCNGGDPLQQNGLTDNWREDIGRIECEDLLAWENAVSSDDEDSDEDAAGVDGIKPASLTAPRSPVIKKQVIQKQQLNKGNMLHEIQKRGAFLNKELDLPEASNHDSNSHFPPIKLRKPVLRRDLVHERDFFLLGSNSWLLVKQKFGYDHELQLNCVFTTDQTTESAVSIVLHEAVPHRSPSAIAGQPAELASSTSGQQLLLPATYIPIPASGHFNYEASMNSRKNRQLQPIMQQHSAPSSPAAVKITTTVASPKASKLQPDGNPNEPAAVGDPPGHVSDDENVEAGDLFTQCRTLDDENNPARSSPGVLLLPPSTTSMVTNSSDDYWNMTSNDENLKSDKAETASDSDVVMDAEVAVAPVVKVQRRPYGSGLGNLGNTCFMNSTLQCLAHTDPLQKYFLSGEYEKDLNRDNPLGTGGDLAVQFAQLLGEMWGTATPLASLSVGGGRRNIFTSTSAINTSNTTNVVYPRNFKYTLGKHAEQFVGYDQHDSQELATYLLDALHEDTNRVTKKPYVEKAEQAEDETDEEAAEKAWQLHLKREDSKVLENFMGLVKSRVQCSTEGCGRVSTTFDPCMYLSVPIPGSSERTIHITYIPVNPNLRAQNLAITLSKSATIGDLLKKATDQLEKFGIIEVKDSVRMEDLCATDVWQKEIYNWYEQKTDIERIRDNDETFVYELRPLTEVREIVEKSAKKAEEDAVNLGMLKTPRTKHYQLDLATLTRVNRGEEWTNELSKYLRSPSGFVNAMHPKRGSTEERMRLYQRLVTFIDLCHKVVEVDTAGQKRAREESPDLILTNPEEETVPEIVDRCDSSNLFDQVKSRHDLAMLEFLSGKMRAEILRLEREKKQEYPDGMILQVRIRKSGSGPISREQNLAAPIVIRIPSNMTVYGLREELAHRLSRSLKVGHPNFQASAGQSTSERDAPPVENLSVEARSAEMNGIDNRTFGSPELLVLRQIPLSYEKRSPHGVRTYSNNGRKLGSLDRYGSSDSEAGRPISLASPTDDEEKALVADIVGDRGTVFMDWPADTCDRYFDVDEYDSVEDPKSSDEEDAARARKSLNTVTVLDCIEKYCQEEQLEETEMWYCNRCQEHVRAWKQFHLYKAPPILIVHLKRFQYSATTHRRDKIGIFIDFPLEGLDLTKHVMHYKEDEKPIYDCYAVSNHYGGLGGGHYTAYALNDDGVWCHYDDSRITTHIDAKEVVSQAAYVLYYRRRDVPWGQDYQINLYTPGLTTPAIIQDTIEKGPDPNASDVSSSNAAMIGDEPMDVDETDAGSRATSPMGSVDEPDETFPEHDYHGDENGLPDSGDRLPLQ